MPKLVSVFPLEWATRKPGATHGSMLTPGVGRSIANPNATVPRVFLMPDWVKRAPPPWRLTDIGINEPPISRRAAVPPYSVTLTPVALGCHDPTVALSVSADSPTTTRPA